MKNKKGNTRRPETKSNRERRSTSCVSYLNLSVLADRIEVFSIYVNHSHRHRIITLLCQESPSPHPLFCPYFAHHLSVEHLGIYLLHLIFSPPCFPTLLRHPSFSPFFLPSSTFCLFTLRLLQGCGTLEDTLFCKSNPTASVLHPMDAHRHGDRLNAG